mmetsp:Transcript_16624/g.52022  ORF Transcript_16624/g.52022 Transcript_16624/m.52022 type:complete len:995 (-) Transcript_16624:636-3620(-)
MDPHVDRLFGFVGLDKLLLRVVKLALVLEVHGILEVNLGQLVLLADAAQVEGVLERPALHGVVDRLLDEPELGEELRALLPAQGHRPGVRHLLGGVDPAVVLRHADRIVPHVVHAVHLNRGLPVLGLHVVVLGLREGALLLENVADLAMRLGEVLAPVTPHQADDMVPEAVLLVHEHRRVHTLDHHVHLLRLPELARGLQLLGPPRVEHVDLVLPHVRHGNLVRGLPLGGAGVHLDGILVHLRADIEALGLLVRARLLVVPRELLVEGQGHAVVLGLDDLHGLGPLPRVDGGVDGLDTLPGFDEMVDRGVDLLLHHEPVPPLLLQPHHLAREVAAGQVHGAAVGVPVAVGLLGGVVATQVLEEFARLLVHARLGKRARDRLEEAALEATPARLHHNLRGAAREAALEVQRDGPEAIAVLLLDGARLLLLPGLDEPVVVVLLELAGLGVGLALRDRDGLLPHVGLGVHLNRLVHLALLQKDLLRCLPLPVEHRDPRADAVVVRAVPSHALLLRRPLRRLAELAEVPGLRDRAQGRVAALRDGELVLLDGKLAELLPHALRFGGERQRLEDVDCALVVPVVQGAPEVDEGLVQRVRHRVDALVDHHLRAPLGAFDVLDLALDGEDRLLLGIVNRIPHAEVAAGLRHDDVRAGHPLHVGAVVEQRSPRLLLQVEEVQLPLFVAEEKVGGAPVELQPVDAAVVVDGGRRDAGDQVEDADRLQIDEVCDVLAVGHVVAVAQLVESHGDEERVHVLRAASPEDLVAAILHQRELAGVVDHAHLLLVEEELLVAAAAPRHLGQLAALEVAHEQGLRGVRDEVMVLVDVYLGDLIAKVALEHDARSSGEALDDHLGVGDVRELELPLVLVAADARVVHVHAAAERAKRHARPVGLPLQGGDCVHVLDDLDPGLLPELAVHVVRKDVEAVEAAHAHRLPAGIELCAGELAHCLVGGVVKVLQHLPLAVVEHHLAVGARRHDRLAPRERVGHAEVVRKLAHLWP